MHAVELVNVSKSFKGSHNKGFLAVETINLQIADGEFFSLLGPSGCGKTTTLRMIAGFEMPTSGEIYIHGQPMRNRPPFHRPVNTVFQNYALFPHLTVAQNVAFGLEMEDLPRQQIRDRVSDTLALVKLSDLEKRYPRQLSGGQQQRVFLARALTEEAEIFCFDEPLVGIDKKTEAVIFDIFHELAAVGKTLMVVNHDLGQAITNFDDLILLNREIIASGSRKQVLSADNLQRAYGGQVVFFSEEAA